MIDWISTNKAWLFDGVLVAVPLAIVGWLLSRHVKRRRVARQMQIQRSGANSMNVQGGRDVTVGETKLGGR